MTKQRPRQRQNSRKHSKIDPYGHLVADIIIAAIKVAIGSGKSLTDDADQIEAMRWLQSDECQRWAEVIGVDIEAEMNHRDSLVRLEEVR